MFIIDRILTFKSHQQIPSPEDLSVFPENTNTERFLSFHGGETFALEQLKDRLLVEREAFTAGTYLPNQANVDILSKSTSMSAALRFGCLSVRKFYYSIHDTFNEAQQIMVHKLPGGHHITGQMIWREFFYVMSVDNGPNYGQMKDNPICLNIPWSTPNEDDVLRWKEGRTGIPIIDAAMRQILVDMKKAIDEVKELVKTKHL
jgi:cryptochrome